MKHQDTHAHVPPTIVIETLADVLGPVPLDPYPCNGSHVLHLLFLRLGTIGELTLVLVSQFSGVSFAFVSEVCLCRLHDSHNILLLFRW